MTTGTARLDAELVRRGLARSRDHAAELVASGAVTVSGTVARRSATRITPDTPLATDTADPTYVSRGAHKLVGALAAFAPQGLRAAGRRCLDVGASTGGFTQVLLGAGAAEVVAVDVGAGQLAPVIRDDPRVRVHDHLNARELTPDLVGTVDLAVADMSFISLTLVLPAIASCVDPAGDLLVMVKPQFEVGRARLSSRGVVREPTHRLTALVRVAASALATGLGTRGVVASPRPGPAGNVEYFLWLRRDAAPAHREALRAAVADGPS